MIELAVNTDYRDDIPSFVKMEEQIALIAKAGFSHIHWCHDWEDSYLYAPSEMALFKKWLEHYQLKVKGLHATEGDQKTRIENNQKIITQSHRNSQTNRKDYTSLNEYSRLAGVELVKNRMELAAKIGAQEIVLHMQMPYEELAKSPEVADQYWQQTFKSFDELVDYSRETGVKIAIENLIWTPMALQIAQFERLFERYSSDFMGLCYDSGHDKLMTNDAHLDFLERFSSRLIALHINDNFGCQYVGEAHDEYQILASDRHQMPYTASIDWERCAQLIAQSAYELPITMELVIPSDYADSELAFLIKAKEQGEALTKRIQYYRQKNSNN